MKKMYFALLAGASWLSPGFPQAAANEADFVTDPVVLHPDQSATPPAPAPMRTASAERPNMGGGFIEFLFGDGQGQGGYQQQPIYQPQRPMFQPAEPQQYHAPAGVERAGTSRLRPEI